MTRTPDQQDYRRALSKLGWYKERDTKHGGLYRSPDGKHTFVLNSNTSALEWRGVKNRLTKLRRQGGEGAALADELTKPKLTLKREERHLCEQHRDAVNFASWEKEVGGVDFVQELRMASTVVDYVHKEADAIRAQRLATTEQEDAPVPKPTVQTAKMSDELQAHHAKRVAEVIAEHFDGEIVVRPGERSVSARLNKYFDEHPKYVGAMVGAAQQLGLVTAEWHKGEVGSRMGRQRITLTAEGRKVAGMDETPAVANGVNGRALGKELAKEATTFVASVTSSPSPYKQAAETTSVSNGIVPAALEEVEASMRDMPPPRSHAEGLAQVDKLTAELKETQELFRLAEEERNAAQAERDNVHQHWQKALKAKAEAEQSLERVLADTSARPKFVYQSLNLGFVATLLERADRLTGEGQDALLKAALAMLNAEVG